MGLHTFLILLDNSNGTYVSQKDSTLITGKVIIVMGKSKQVEAIRLNFKGKAKVVWSETHGKVTVTYVGRQKFFSQTYNLVGGTGEEMREKILLPSGEHSFAFSLRLPPDLPSSCKEKFGRIKYSIEAVVERSWKTNFKTKRQLNIVAPLDLTTPPGVMLPVRSSSDKFFCCLWCRSGPLTLALSIPSRGIVIGKPFPITVEVDNASNVDVDAVVGKIKKYTTFRLEPPKCHSRLTKTTLCTFPIGAAARRTTLSHTVLLPPLNEPAINVDQCFIIDINYFLVVKASSSGCHGELKVKTAVKFGSLPEDRYAFQFTNAGFVADFDALTNVRPLPPPYSPPLDALAQ